jgi:hypothetical protein
METLLDISILHHIGDAFAPDNLSALQDHLHSSAAFLAQRVEDPNVLGKMQQSWQNFVKTGQIWALLIGLFIGYLFKSFTSY